MSHSQDPNLMTRRTLIGLLSTIGLSLPAAKGLAGVVHRVPKFDPRFELLVSYTIATQDDFRVHRPYVAVWIEDKAGNSVRTLNLLVQTTRRGPRWIPDLKRWFRKEQDRVKVNGGDLVQSISGPTREAGKYSVAWDGKNDAGTPVLQGEYTVCIEAAREHGTYQLITQAVKVGTKPFVQKLEGNLEISEAQIEFRKHK